MIFSLVFSRVNDIFFYQNRKKIDSLKNNENVPGKTGFGKKKKPPKMYLIALIY